MNGKLYYSDKKRLAIYIIDAKFNKETIEIVKTTIDDIFPDDYRVLVLPSGTEVIDMDNTKED
ncbi:hypothetical protein [Staphylococcus kloosii]|jgi:hypothetical protein|uniref:hypothetical protein n=1 Tax=Staphylococcus kloosii TaxID=29384 RepID=UPI0018A0631C|nr:hypothetical protein [Staphylococcus kloosii]MBF7022499.1 hypothetical protein [Staphylococcus kloosii]